MTNDEPIQTKKLDISILPKNHLSRLSVEIATDPLGLPISLPVIVAKGSEDGPTVGITAAVHGNELNGIFVIQELFRRLRINEIKGSIIGIPVVNVYGYLNNQREFIDGADLNTIMPGSPNGNQSQVFVHRFIKRIVEVFNYNIDLHTASFGRINTHYVRADLSRDLTAWMASQQHADIILNSEPSQTTLRGTCAEMGIPSITIEIGNPQRFQIEKVGNTILSIKNILKGLKIVPGIPDLPEQLPVVCRRSYWLRSSVGGVLTVFPELGDNIVKNEIIAVVRDIFGDVVKEFASPEDGIVIGKNSNPVALSGSRIIHLGLIEDIDKVKEILNVDWIEDQDD